MGFFQSLHDRQQLVDSHLCVGLDTQFSKIPVCIKDDPANHGDSTKIMVDFNRRIVRATADQAASFKIQSSFYEAMGAPGILAMERTVDFIHDFNSDIPVTNDAKRMDIGNTNLGYVEAIFGYHGFNAVTIQPYMGWEDAADVFLNETDRGLIVLARTSNPGAKEFQDRWQLLHEDELAELLEGGFRTIDKDLLLGCPVVKHADMDAALGSNVGMVDPFFTGKLVAIPMYLYVALRVAYHWNKAGNCGVVVGTTFPEEGGVIRSMLGDMDFLMPGSGKLGQGGKIEPAVTNCQNSLASGMILNFSRTVTFASDGSDFEEKAAEAAKWYREEINKHRRAAHNRAENNKNSERVSVVRRTDPLATRHRKMLFFIKKKKCLVSCFFHHSLPKNSIFNLD